MKLACWWLALASLVFVGCVKENVISPNEQGQVVMEAVNCRFTFDLDDHLLTVQNFNAAVVWVKVSNQNTGGVLFNYFIWSQRVSTRTMGSVQKGNQITGRISYFDWSGSETDPLPPGADIWDFILALGGLLPFKSEEFQFTVG